MAYQGLSNESKQFLMRFKKLGFVREASKTESIDINKLKKRLNEIQVLNFDTIVLPKKTLGYVKSMTQKLVKEFFRDVDMKVDIFENESSPNYARSPFFKKLCNIINGNVSKEEKIKYMLEMYKQHSKKESALQVPIVELHDEHAMHGLTFKGPCVAIEDDEFLKKAPVYAEAIMLGTKQVNLLSVGTYMHEITHLLLDRHKKVVENYYNDELLSIFIEKVAVDKLDDSYNKKILKFSEVYRLLDVKRNINEMNFNDPIGNYERFKYIQSSLYAGLLFDKYSTVDKTGKEEIMSMIREILSGKRQVKDLIEMQELMLTEENIFKYVDKVERYSKELARRQPASRNAPGE